MFTPSTIDTRVLPLLRDPARLDTMGKAAAGMGERRGDERLADLVYEAYAAAPEAGATS